MKGIELPVNVLIILAVAVIVLIALIAMFYPAFINGSGTASMDMAKSQACRSLLVGYDCKNSDGRTPATSITGIGALALIKVDNYDVDGIEGLNSNGDTLWNLCRLKYQIATEADCRKLCSCTV
jgi:hypothetical protein